MLDQIWAKQCLGWLLHTVLVSIRHRTDNRTAKLWMWILLGTGGRNTLGDNKINFPWLCTSYDLLQMCRVSMRRDLAKHAGIALWVEIARSKKKYLFNYLIYLVIYLYIYTVYIYMYILYIIDTVYNMCIYIYCIIYIILYYIWYKYSTFKRMTWNGPGTRASSDALRWTYSYLGQIHRPQVHSSLDIINFG